MSKFLKAKFLLKKSIMAEKFKPDTDPEEPKKTLIYDDIAASQQNPDPIPDSHVDIPDDDKKKEEKDPELRKRKEEALRRSLEREAALDQTPGHPGDAPASGNKV
jgi:hypothetical protein